MEMPKGVRRTLEQQLADMEAKANELKAKIKARSSFNPDHKAVKAIIESIEKTASDNDWAVKDLVKAIADKLTPRKTRTPKA